MRIIQGEFVILTRTVLVLIETEEEYLEIGFGYCPFDEAILSNYRFRRFL